MQNNYKYGREDPGPKHTAPAPVYVGNHFQGTAKGLTDPPLCSL